MNKNLLIFIMLFLAAILSARFFNLDFNPGITALFIALFLVSLVISRERNKIFFILLCLLFFTLGIYRYSTEIIRKQNDISYLASEKPKEVILKGLVIEDPEGYETGRIRFTLRAAKMFTDDDEVRVTGKVFIKVLSYDKRVQIGDILVLGGKIQLPEKGRPDSTFDWRKYLEARGIFTCMASRDHDIFSIIGRSKSIPMNIKRCLFSLRQKAKRVLGRYMYGEEGAILESVVLGSREGLSNEVKKTFSRTGTMHILAVSGLHIGIVGLMFMWVLKIVRCPKRIMYYIAIAFICMFAVLTGGRASSLRAAIMGSLVLLALSRGQKIDTVGTLVLSAFLITFPDPSQIFQIGFILSFMAVLSIIYITPLVEHALNIKLSRLNGNVIGRVTLFFTKSISVSTSVWIGIFPLILLYFNLITPYVVIVNLIAVPALFLMVFLVILLLFVGWASFMRPVASLLTALLNFIISTFLQIIRNFERLPFSYIEISARNSIIVYAYYFVLILVLICYNKKTSKVA